MIVLVTNCLIYFYCYFQNKPILVEPIDFESFVQKNKTLIQNDPQRELLMYPSDDVSEVVLPKKFRTLHNNIPSPVTKKETSRRPSDSSSISSNSSSPSNFAQQPAQGHLLTRQALHTYETANHVIHYKCSAYGGTCYELPK